MAQVKIGPSFFAKAKFDYNDWKWAWVRELAQNSIDAPGCDRIEFSFALSPDGKDTCVACSNNGKPMDVDILVNKFLAIGESGKNFEGSVGGFGKAKELIAFTHKSYYIRTGTLMVQGSGAEYNLSENLGYEHGTTTQVVMAGDVVGELIAAAKKFAALAQWHGVVSVNGEEFACELRKGSPRRGVAFGTVYTNKSSENILIVRMHGIPMFCEWIDLNRCVILELSGSSADVLTSNRDGLTGVYARQLSQFVTELAVDKKSALKPRQARYRHYSGTRYGHHVQSGVNVKELVAVKEVVVQQPISATTDVVEVEEVATSFAPAVAAFTPSSTSIKAAPRVVSQISSEFIIKNETELAVPEYYLPENRKFCGYAKKLARIWGRLLLELHKMTETEGDFAIGFLFDESAAAEHEEGNYGTAYYISPAVLVEQRSSRSKSFKKRWNLTDRNQLLAVAVHEFVHGGFGHKYHDENYAGKLTDLMGQVMDERRRFNWCFTG